MGFIKMDFSYEAHVNSGDWHYHNKDYDAALKEYEQAIVMDTSCPVGYCKRRLVYCALGKYDLANQYFNRVRGFDLDNQDFNERRKLYISHAEAYKVRGDLACKLEKYDEAISDYKKAIELKLEFAEECKENLPSDFRQKLEDHILILKLDKAVAANPNDANAHFERGNFYFKLKILDKAIPDYARAIELKPEFAEECKKNLPSDFYQRVEEYLKDANGYNNRGKAHLKQKKYDEAIQDFNKALELIKVDCAVAYNNRGKAYLEQEKYDEAIQDFNDAISSNSRYAPAYYNLARAYDKLGEKRKALCDYIKARDLDPSFKKKLSAEILEKIRLVEELDKLNRAIESKPFDVNTANVYNKRGVIRYKLEEYDEAIQDFDDAVDLKEDFGEAYYNRGLSYCALGNYPQAIQDFGKALQHNWNFAETVKNLNDALEKLKSQ